MAYNKGTVLNQREERENAGMLICYWNMHDDTLLFVLLSTTELHYVKQVGDDSFGCFRCQTELLIFLPCLFFVPYKLLPFSSFLLDFLFLSMFCLARDGTDELRMAVKEAICENEGERNLYEEALIAIRVDEPLNRYVLEALTENEDLEVCC